MHALSDMPTLPVLPPVLPADVMQGLTGITADSRAVRPGMLYAALPGNRLDGRAFIADAVSRGAAAVLAPEGTVWPEGVPSRPLIQDREPRRALARLAAAYAGVQPRTLVAITGTNGKTSTAEFFRQIVQAAGHHAASIGTLGIVSHGAAAASGPALTTPDPVALAEILAGLARTGVAAVALEASSHGLAQFRLDGLRFAAAAFTNLTRDHMDYHGTPDAYRGAKLRLFTELLPEGAPALASTTLDPETSEALRAVAARRNLAFGTVGEGGTVFDLVSATPHGAGQVLVVREGGATCTLDLPVPGRFQADNALLAAALARAVGIEDPLALLPGLHGVHGRMELVATHGGAAAYVDYAHTPDALDRLLAALRPHTAGRLVLVFGAGGDRDPGKRPLMGEAAARGADHVIITDDNPRGEDPAVIRAAIRAACPGAIEISDRAQAIAAGLRVLRPGDVLAVAGKGHETGQTTAGVTVPFDDGDTVRRLAVAA